MKAIAIILFVICIHVEALAPFYSYRRHNHNDQPAADHNHVTTVPTDARRLSGGISISVGHALIRSTSCLSSTIDGVVGSGDMAPSNRKVWTRRPMPTDQSASSVTSSSSSGSSTARNNAVTNSQTSLERSIRNAITRKDWELARREIATAKSSVLDSGRNIVFVILETCRRADSIEQVVPLLNSISFSASIDAKEDDVIPTLSAVASTATQNTRRAHDIVVALEKRGVTFTARTYSILLKGDTEHP